MTQKRMPLTRFATVEEVMSPEFSEIIHVLDDIAIQYQLADHSEINRVRYPWAKSFLRKPAFYAARLWEYRFAIRSATLAARKLRPTPPLHEKKLIML